MAYETLKRGDSLLALLTLSYFVCFCSGQVIDRIQQGQGQQRKQEEEQKVKQNKSDSDLSSKVTPGSH